MIWLARALELGTKPSDFDDKEFRRYLKDKAVVALFKTKRG